MLEPAQGQGLQSPPIDLQIVRGINAGLLGFAQRLRARSSEGDDQDFRPVLLDLFEKVPGFPGAQIQKKHRGTGLLKHSVQPIREAHMAHLRQRAQERFDAPDEV